MVYVRTPTQFLPKIDRSRAPALGSRAVFMHIWRSIRSDQKGKWIWWHDLINLIAYCDKQVPFRARSTVYQKNQLRNLKECLGTNCPWSKTVYVWRTKDIVLSFKNLTSFSAQSLHAAGLWRTLFQSCLSLTLLPLHSFSPKKISVDGRHSFPGQTLTFPGHFLSFLRQ